MPDFPDYRRWSFLAIALLFHAIVFFLVCHLIIFPAPSVPQEDVTAFTKIAIPAKPLPPPSAPSESGGPAMPTVNITPAPPVVAPIVTMTPTTFTMPKIALPALEMPKLPVTPSSITADNGNSLGGQGTGAGTGTGNSVPGMGGLADAINNDSRPGDIIAVLPGDEAHFMNVSTIDQIIQHDFTNVGVCIYFDHPGFPAGIYYGQNSPSAGNRNVSFKVRKFLDCATYSTNCIGEIGTLTHADTKTIILFYSFEEPYDSSKFDSYCEMLTNALASHKIKLCVISFKNAPYPLIMKYVQESGGSVSYPKDTPHQNKQ